jgi:hypothetical protein
VNRQVLRFAGYRFRATFARTWGGGLAIVLLIGLLGGVGLGALSGARRTQSSFSTYLASTNPSDLGVAAFTPSPRDFTAAIRHLPLVRKVAGFVSYDAEMLPARGAPIELLPSVSLVGSLGGEFFDQDRFRVIEGHMADPRRADEVMVSEVAAQVLHLHVGEVLTLRIGANPGGPGKRTRLIVVGIGLLNNQVVQDNIERLPSYIVATPRLTAALPLGTAATRWYEIQVQGGSRNVPAVEREVFNHIPAYIVFHVTSVFAAQAELAIKPDAIALWGFGVIAALAGLLLALQAISRQLQARKQDLAVLRAIGADPTMTTSDGLIATLGAVVVGSVLAVIVDVALSPLSPIGPARRVFPTRGVNLDWTIIGLGLAVLFGGLGVMTVVIAYRGTPHRGARRGAFASRPSAVARGVASAGLPPSAAVGVHFALEPGAGNSSPVRSALLGAVLAVLTVVATLTFGSSLSTLLSHPALYGWTWDSVLDSSLGYGPVPPKAQKMLDHDPEVAAWTGVTFFTMQLDGVAAPVLFVDAPAAFSPPILSGHVLTAPDQIVVGAATLVELHKRVGDHVLVSYGTAAQSLSRSLLIVGTTTLPAIGISEGLHTSMGTGALVPNAAFPMLSEQGYPAQCNGPNMALVRFRKGVAPAAADASLRHIAAAANAEFTSASSSNACSLLVSVLGVQQPAQIRDYGTVGASPAVLASGLAGGAIVALGFTLVASVRRRRRELALLKALGFTQRQLAATISWQASVAGVVGVVVGLPLGIALGRWLWSLFAAEVFAVPRPSVPVGSLVLVAVGALALVNVVAALPGLSAARTRIALVLRAE